MRWLLLIGLITGIVWGSEAGTQIPVIEVSCPDPSSCLGLLEKAISTAPEGAVIQLSELSKGIYYEHPLIIDKSLTIRGITYPWNLIIAVDHGYFLTVRYPGHPITVTLDNLVIRNSLVDVGPWSSSSKEGTGTAILLEGPAEGAPEDLKLIISDSGIVATGSIVKMQGKAQLTIRGSELLSKGWGLWAEGGGKLMLEGNGILIEPDYFGDRVGLYLKDVEARLQGNIIMPTTSGTPMKLGFGITANGGKYYLIKNRIEGFSGAVALAMKADADFQENSIVENCIGIMLFLPSCLGAAMTPEFQFEGKITGTGNVLLYNDRDLCPEDYPWPEGFVKGP
ncbi:MAG: hypothetical protein ACUVUT_06065 [Candidatus Bipolaricaulia bacterium]